MKRKIITTADGSKTIHLEEWNEQYHSKHGAIQEARHVFIKNGLQYLQTETACETVRILEIGFGTGLNAFLSSCEADRLQIAINYQGIEAYPVSEEEIDQLNYAQLISKDQDDRFQKLHGSVWEEEVEISPLFKLIKRQQLFSEITDKNAFNLIFFDAFGPRVQPELWTEDIFKKMYDALKDNGILVTYSAKGDVKRALLGCGFELERLKGPPGKRHMLRATKKR
ncbi:MAG: tRNA (5-methylaminomethyl-2-thiouridine)(34)-methyltransferase MnmD [Flavobacteriaceae bacterium]|nr:tRNA (5-methylaminomethyl-2-thiouridine)(34)-methyltransferase MnmD [Flavobacteriaceae bacterium]